jgi:hypothetical protein
MHLLLHYGHNLLHWIIGPVVALSDYPIYAQNVGIALLTVLIPFIIAVFADILSKLGKPDEKLNELDRRVLLYSVFGLPYRFLTILLLIFLPVFYWDSLNHVGRAIIILLNIIGAAGMIQIYLALFNWAMGRKDPYRIKQLVKLKKGDDIVYSWRSVWQPGNDIIFESNAFDAFDKTVRRLLSLGPDRFKEFGAVTFALIPDFTNHIKTGDPVEFILYRGKGLQKALQWHQISWLKSESRENQDATWSEYYGFNNHVEGLLNELYEQIIHRDLTYVMFQELEAHVSANKDAKYLQHLMQSLYKPIFELSTYNFWRDFPQAWKLTEKTLNKRDNIIQATTFQNYANWAMSAIDSSKSEIQEQFSLVTRELFPDLDPADFTLLLRLLLQPYGGGRMQSIIESEWYPTMGRMASNTKELIATQSVQRVNAIDFAVKHFSLLNNYNKQTIKSYMNELNALKFASKTSEEYKRQRIIKLLKDVEQYEKDNIKQ